MTRRRSVATRGLVFAVLLGCLLSAAPALAGQFSGQVTDWQTGEPLAGIQVRIYDGDMLWSGAGPAAALGWTTTTDAAGNWSVVGLPDKYLAVGFVDTTNSYRDMMFPQTGTRPEDALCYNPGTFVGSVDCELVPLSAIPADRTWRVAGDTRYSTALAISQANFYAADAAVVVSGENFADALAAAPLAGSVGGPLLLTTPTKLQASLIKELDRLGVNTIYVVGGEASVSRTVYNALKAEGFAMNRIAGADRYATSAAVARKVTALNGPMAPFICRGDIFADALSLSPFAYIEGRPILLTKPTTLPGAVADYWADIAPYVDKSIFIVGGTNSVTKSVMDDLAWETGGSFKYWRFAGADRYSTCLAIIKGYTGGVRTADTIGIASGDTYADALAGGPGIGNRWGWMLLTPGKGLRGDTAAEIKRNGPYTLELQVFGGPRTLTTVTEAAAGRALGTVAYDIDAPGNRVALGGVSGLAFATASASDRLADLAPSAAAAAPAKPQLRIAPVDMRSHSVAQ